MQSDSAFVACSAEAADCSPSGDGPWAAAVSRSLGELPWTLPALATPQTSTLSSAVGSPHEPGAVTVRDAPGVAPWRQLPRLRRLAGFTGCCAPAECRATLAVVRCVDDATGISRRLCAQCIGLWIQATNDGIPFDVEHSTLTSDTVPWLDAYVYLHRWPPTIIAAEPERVWLDGSTCLPKKIRVPPWMGVRDEEALRSLIRGRLARLLQMRLGPQAVLQALHYD